MKKQRILTMIVCISMIFSLAGCAGSTDQDKESSEEITTTAEDNVTTAPTEEETESGPEIDYDNLVTSAFEKDAMYEYDGVPQTIATYSIPQINLSGADIERINTEIYDEQYPSAEKSISEVEETGNPYTSGNVSYYWSVNDDILSLVVRNYLNPDSSGGFIYMVYNVSISEATALSDESVYAAAGLSKEEYYDSAEQMLESYFKDGYVAIEGNYDEFYENQLAKTVAEQNIDESYVYLGEDGHLCIVSKVYSMAGADYYWHVLDLTDEKCIY